MHESSEVIDPSHASRPPRRRRAALVGLRLALAALLGLGTAAPAGAEQARDVTVRGDVVTMLPEAAGDTRVRAAVEVDGVLVTVPPALADQALAATGEVELTVRVGSGVDRRGALAALATNDASAQVVGLEQVGAPTQAAGRTVTGTHQLTVVPVTWGGTDGTSTDALRAWGQQTATYWSEQSAGRIAVNVDVRPWATIADPRSCDEVALMNAATAAAGISTVDTFHHVAVYFPHRGDCGWDGLATIGSGRVWINGTTVTDVLSHELGHNLGLGHANTATCAAGGGRVPLVLPVTGCALAEYGDRADVMGIGIASLPTGNLTTAAADWLGLASVTQVPLGGSADVTLAPLSSVGSMRAVAIPVSGGTVYVDFRPWAGRDQRVAGWAGVQVHLQVLRGTGANVYPVTYLLDMTPTSSSPFQSAAFGVGGRWEVPGTGMVVQVTSAGTGPGSTATVRVAPGAGVPSSVVQTMPVDSPQVFRAGQWYLRGSYTSGGADAAFGFGSPGDRPVSGDWDGNGSITPGVFRGGQWFLRQAKSAGAPDLVFAFGSPGDVPVVGDWDGDGVETPGVFRNGVWYLRNSNTSGAADLTFRYGSPGDVPVVGDWDGNGTDTLGVFRGGRWYLTNRDDSGYAESVSSFGQPGDVPVVGDWDRDGRDTFGVFRSGTWYLTNRLASGAAQGWFSFGSPGDVPLLFR